MKITVVLPWYDNKYPSGGVLNIYKYIEQLVEYNYQISIIYDCNMGKGKFHIPNYFSYQKRKYITMSKCGLNNLKNVKEIPVFCVKNHSIPDADYIIATALITVHSVKKLNHEKGRKVYFIQGFENWGKSDSYVYKSYGLGMINIAVSKWLYDLVELHSKSKTYYLPNAIDEDFYSFCDIEIRNPKKIVFMYVPIKSKGTYDLIDALKIVHKKQPDILIEAFGIYPRCNDLPSFVSYTYNPNRKLLNEIYNRNAIFVCASWLEGFGLTAGESMKSGCCLVTTNNKGVLDFAVDGETAFLSEPKNPDLLAQKIEYVLENNEIRIKVAKRGMESISKFNWKRNVEKIDEIFKGNL